jgi:ADP-ribose pyrophosphatase
MSDEYVFRGRLVSVRVSDGHEVVEHPGSVAILAIDAEGRVVLTSQRRPAVGRGLLEIPAGTRDEPDEAPPSTARRELEEEVGLQCERLEHLGSFYPSPGYTSERQELYLAIGARGHPHDAELVPLKEAVGRVLRREIEDLKTAFAILLAAQRLG